MKSKNSGRLNNRSLLLVIGLWAVLFALVTVFEKQIQYWVDLPVLCLFVFSSIAGGVLAITCVHFVARHTQGYLSSWSAAVSGGAIGVGLLWLVL